MFEAWVIALADDEVVGLRLDPPQRRSGALWQRADGGAPAWRNRGVAIAIKRRQIAWARSAGVRVDRTSNELRNAPMRRVNEHLGYVREPDEVVLRGSFP